MKPDYRNFVIAIGITSAFVSGYSLGYFIGYYPTALHNHTEQNELLKRIIELEAREKSRTSSDTNTEQPPKNE